MVYTTYSFHIEMMPQNVQKMFYGVISMFYKSVHHWKNFFVVFYYFICG